VKDGKAEVTKGRFISDPVEIEVGGNIQLRKDLERSRIDLEITLKFNESLDRLARLAPMLSAGRDPDGTYHLGAMGTVLAPRLREDRTATKRKTTSSAGAIDSEGSVGSSQSAEEREKAREERLERLKERRERMRQQREASGSQTPPQDVPLIDPAMEERVPPPFLEDGGPMDIEEEGPPPHEPGYVDEPPPAEPEPVEGPYIEE
jgi:hypothetical protein